VSCRPAELIEQGAVVLRRLRADDADALYQAVAESGDHLSRWMPWAPGYTREAAVGYLAASDRAWEEGEAYNYAIVVEGKLAGDCGLMARIGPGALEIGYWVHRGYTRRSLATTAARALVGEAFRLPGVTRVEMLIDELNVASAGVPRKLGFSPVGRRPVEPRPAAGSGMGIVWRLVRPE
jgi:RimJ/RimL family protein N-acetyltransferase